MVIFSGMICLLKSKLFTSTISNNNNFESSKPNKRLYKELEMLRRIILTCTKRTLTTCNSIVRRWDEDPSQTLHKRSLTSTLDIDQITKEALLKNRVQMSRKDQRSRVILVFLRWVPTTLDQARTNQRFARPILFSSAPLITIVRRGHNQFMETKKVRKELLR